METGRGRLCHWAAVDAAGAVTAYAVVSPTDWNFAPQGPFQATVAKLSADSPQQAERMLSLLASLFDPCLPFHIDLREAADA